MPEILDITGAARTAINDPGTGRQPVQATTGQGVRAQHVSYASMRSKWQRCRDVIAGEAAMHMAGERYLAKLADQTATDYSAMVERTTFYNATWRTIVGLRGMMFRKPPEVEVPPAVEELLDDVTLDGQSFLTFMQSVAEEALSVGRLGILVDYPVVKPSAELTLADARTLNLRPTLALYSAEDIINWRMRTIANASKLALIVLRESHAVALDEFTNKNEDRYRVLDLDVQGLYRQRLFRIDKNGRDELIGPPVYPKLNGGPLDFIPFVFQGVDDLTPEVDEPPLIDLVDMNVHHYKVTCDYEHGCHFTGLPTPCVAGYQKDTPDEKLYVGSTVAWMFANPAAKWGYLEFSGSGLASLERNLDRKEQAMAVLGARMLEPQKRAVEAADTAAIHRVGEESALAGMAQTLSDGLTRALRWFANWAGAASDNVSVTLNKEFFPAPVDPATITTLMAQWQGGGVSYQTYFDNIKKAEIVPPDRTAEEEQALIMQTPPMMLGGYPEPQPQSQSPPPGEGA